MRLALSLVLAAGCFGQGPVPDQPTGASVVFAAGAPAPQDCSTGPSGNYVGDVAFNPDHGYALVLGYTLECGGGAGAGAGLGGPLPVFQFANAGGTPSKLGEVPATTVPPRLAASGSTLWAYQGRGQLTVATATGTIYQTTTQDAAALLVDDAAAYLVANTMNGNAPPDLDNPDYPCCGGLVSDGVGMSPLIKLALPGGAAPALPGMTTLPVTPACYKRSMKNCLAQNATSLFYPAAATGHTAAIRSFPKTATAVSDEKTLGAVDGDVVVTGLEANAHTVVWSVGPVVGNQPPPSASCAITVFDLDTGTMKMLVSTSAFSCQDVALAGDAVYFTIVTISVDNGGQAMRGLGIGRVSLSAPTFESIAVNDAVRSAGPRRIYTTDAGEVYAVDLFTIAKLDTRVLDGRSDFALQ